MNVYVVVAHDYDDHYVVAVYAKKGEANKKAKELDAAQPPRETVYADGVARYVHTVERVIFHS